MIPNIIENSKGITINTYDYESIFVNSMMWIYKSDKLNHSCSFDGTFEDISYTKNGISYDGFSLTYLGRQDFETHNAVKYLLQFLNKRFILSFYTKIDKPSIMYRVLITDIDSSQKVLESQICENIFNKSRSKMDIEIINYDHSHGNFFSIDDCLLSIRYKDILIKFIKGLKFVVEKGNNSLQFNRSENGALKLLFSTLTYYRYFYDNTILYNSNNKLVFENGNVFHNGSLIYDRKKSDKQV